MFRARMSAVVGAAMLAAVASGCVSTGTARPSAFPGAPNPSGSATPSMRRPSFAGPAVSVDALAVIESALQYRGVPYRFGGEEPVGGFDCSGFVRYVFELHQLALPRTVEEQYEIGKKVSLSRLAPGDLIFFSTIGPGATHVGISIGADEFVHAPGTGAVVRIDRVDAAYWKERAIGVRRVY